MKSYPAIVSPAQAKEILHDVGAIITDSHRLLRDKD